ncbi:hypothetical protein C0992_001943, partial [Termitomyces sp. T32_za158]
MGDYLDVNGKSAFGSELASACGIGCESRSSLGGLSSADFGCSGTRSVQREDTGVGFPAWAV